MGVSVSNESVYNAVVALGGSSNSDIPPVSAVAIDDNPASPTRWGGPLGKKPKILEQDELLGTVELCQAKADLLLQYYVAESRTLDMTALPNPALEPGDVVAISMLDGTVENHLLVSTSIPLGIGTWTADTLSTRAIELQDIE
jgi:hypothetical protein